MPKMILALIFFWVLIPTAQAEECEYVCEYVCDGVAVVDYDYSKKIILSEIYPAPLDGEDEFIELQNTGKKKVNLAGWYLTDASGKKYELSGEIDEYLTIYQADSKIYLNNSGDEINLYQPDDTLLDSVVYDSTGESGWSYAYDSPEWSWTTLATPGSANEIIVDEESSEQDDQESEETDEETAENSEVQSISDIRNLEKGTNVIVQGVVVAIPDTLSSQIFYLQDQNAGIQIYSSKKTFPDLSLGDLIQVQGELSEAYEEKKINIQSEDQITILGTGEASATETQELTEELEGQLVFTAGQIAEKDGSKLYLTNDIIVYKKSAVDISFSDLDEGDNITVTGIVGEYKGEYRLMPRFAEDLILNEKYEAISQGANSLIKAAQAAELTDSSWSLPSNPQQKNVLYILIGVIAALFLALIFVSWPKIKELAKKIRNTDVNNSNLQ